MDKLALELLLNRTRRHFLRDSALGLGGVALSLLGGNGGVVTAAGAAAASTTAATSVTTPPPVPGAVRGGGWGRGGH